jgi:hypothetical protein
MGTSVVSQPVAIHQCAVEGVPATKDEMDHTRPQPVPSLPGDRSPRAYLTNAKCHCKMSDNWQVRDTAQAAVLPDRGISIQRPTRPFRVRQDPLAAMEE